MNKSDALLVVCHIATFMTVERKKFKKYSVSFWLKKKIIILATLVNSIIPR